MEIHNGYTLQEQLYAYMPTFRTWSSADFKNLDRYLVQQCSDTWTNALIYTPSKWKLWQYAFMPHYKTAAQLYYKILEQYARLEAVRYVVSGYNF